MMIKILIVDDEPIIQHGISSMIDCSLFNQPQIKTADNGENALKIIETWHPDLIFLDIKMPRLDSLSTMERLDLSSPGAPIVIILTNYNDFDYTRTALRSGAFDYLIKVELSVELVNQVITNALLASSGKKKQLSSVSEADGLYQSQISLFYTRLLWGCYHTLDEITNAKKLLHIDFEFNQYFTVYFDRLTTDEQHSDPPITSSVHYIHSLLQRSFQTDRMGYILPAEKQGSFFVLTGIFSKDHASLLYDTISHCLSMIYRYTNLTYAAGVGGPVTDMTSIPFTFRESLLAFDHCTSESPIVSGDAFPHKSVPVNYHTQVLIPNVKSYIENHYREQITLSSVAEIFHLSSNYLSALFNKYTNTSFSNFVNRVKISHAKEMFLKEHMTLQQVSDHLGYTDPYYFSKVFKKIVGISVREFISQSFPKMD